MTSKNDLSIAEVAQRVKVTVETARRWCRSGELPSRQIGAKHLYRVKVDDLEAYLAKGN